MRNVNVSRLRAVAICTLLLASACSARTEPPRAAPASSCIECEQLLKATILKSIDDEERHKRELARARAGEGIAQSQAREAASAAEAAEAWQRWGPIGIVAAFIAGAITSALAAQ